MICSRKLILWPKNGVCWRDSNKTRSENKEGIDCVVKEAERLRNHALIPLFGTVQRH